MTVNHMQSQSLHSIAQSHESGFIVCLSERALEPGLFRSMRICTTKHGTSLKTDKRRGTDVPVGTLN